jgi:ParB family chromosome partitioning protein
MTPYPSSPQAPVPQAVPVAVTAAGDAEEREIPVAEAGPDPDQPRKEFDPEREQELAASIREHGQLNAILVYVSTVPPRYRILGGERRWRACQRLGRKTIRARILKEPPNEAKRRELALLDNEQRQDLSDIERGLAYGDFLTRTGCTASALAQKLGKHVSTITRAIGLVRKLPEDLRSLVGPRLPPSVASVLTALPDDEAKRKFAALYCDGTYRTAEQVAAAIKAARNGQTTGAPASFTAQAGGIAIMVTLPPTELARAAAALRQLAKDVSSHGHSLADLKNFLARKHKLAAARQAAAAAAEALRAAP